MDVKSHQQAAFLRHHKKVSDCARLMAALPPGECSIHHGRTGHTLRAFTYKAQRPSLDFSQFNACVSVDVDKQVAYVEPGMRMDTFVDHVLSLGLRPKVVPEFKAITVGGAIQGLAGESSSFQYGFFHHACLAYEVLLGQGEVVVASPTENADLFFALPGSYGSLGVITLVTISLLPAKPYVLLQYQKTSAHAPCSWQPQTDYRDAMITDDQTAIVVNGYERDQRESGVPLHRARHWFSPWYYSHVLASLQRKTAYAEIMPVRDYFFRYDRGAFWMVNLKLSHTLLNRVLWGAQLTSERMYQRTLTKTPLHTRERHKVVQDIMVPQARLASTLQYLQQHIEIYPLWILPMHNPCVEEELFAFPANGQPYVNIGVYGIPTQSGDLIERQIALDQYLAGIQGRRVLHAQSYCSRALFWQIYDEARYNRLRHTYHAQGRFIDIYEKVSECYRAYQQARGA
jgi:delta24-sterol reductase